MANFETALQMAAKAIDREVIPPLRQPIIGRKVVATNPTIKGDGIYNVDVTTMSEMSAATVSMSLPVPDANRDNINLVRTNVKVPVVAKNFQIERMEWNAWQNANVPFDMYAAQSAAYQVQKAEDQLIFQGNSALGINGFYTGATSTFGGAATGTYGNTTANVTSAINVLNQANVFAPAYNLVMNPAEYNKLTKCLSTTGIPEIWYVMSLLNPSKGLAELTQPGWSVPGTAGFTEPSIASGQDVKNGVAVGGIFMTPAITGGTALLMPVDPNRVYGQMYVVQDLRTVLGYDSRALETSPIYGSLFELVLPQLRQPIAYCTITGIT